MRRIAKLEAEREKREALLAEYKQSERETKEELQRKSDKIADLVDSYEQRIQGLQAQVKAERKRGEAELAEAVAQRELLDFRVRELEAAQQNEPQGDLQQDLRQAGLGNMRMSSTACAS